jgi:hypothetical protein
MAVAVVVARQDDGWHTYPAQEAKGVTNDLVRYPVAIEDVATKEKQMGARFGHRLRHRLQGG